MLFSPVRCCTLLSDAEQCVGRCAELCYSVLCLQETLVVADAELVKEVTLKKFKVFRNRPGPDELQKDVLNGIVLGR